MYCPLRKKKYLTMKPTTINPTTSHAIDHQVAKATGPKPQRGPWTLNPANIHIIEHLRVAVSEYAAS